MILARVHRRGNPQGRLLLGGGTLILALWQLLTTLYNYETLSNILTVASAGHDHQASASGRSHDFFGDMSLMIRVALCCVVRVAGTDMNLLLEEYLARPGKLWGSADSVIERMARTDVPELKRLQYHIFQKSHRQRTLMDLCGTLAHPHACDYMHDDHGHDDPDESLHSHMIILCAVKFTDTIKIQNVDGAAFLEAYQSSVSVCEYLSYLWKTFSFSRLFQG